MHPTGATLANEVRRECAHGTGARSNAAAMQPPGKLEVASGDAQMQSSPVATSPSVDVEGVNSAPTYTATARRFHWWTAALVTVQIPIGLYMANQGNTLNIPDGTLGKLFSTHKLIGIAIFFLVVARLAYRFLHGKPPDETSIAPWQKIASHINHWGLYFLLVLVPLGGFIGILLYPSLEIFGVTLPALLSPDRDVAERVFYWHMVGAFGILVLAGIHAIAVAYHYYIRRDGVLRRMLLRAGRYSLEPGLSRTGGSPTLPSTAPR
jgi:cytochrome b561